MNRNKKFGYVWFSVCSAIVLFSPFTGSLLASAYAYFGVSVELARFGAVAGHVFAVYWALMLGISRMEKGQ